MKKMIALFALMYSIISFSQKVEIINYEQLTNYEQAKFLSEKIDFKAIQMPDGQIIKIGDPIRLGEPYGSNQRPYKGIMENTYSTLQYGGAGADIGEDEKQWIFAADKGKNAKIFKFKPTKKLDGTIYVEIIIKTVNKNDDFNGWGRARGSLESFEKGELIKIE